MDESQSRDELTPRAAPSEQAIREQPAGTLSQEAAEASQLSHRTGSDVHGHTQNCTGTARETITEYNYTPAGTGALQSI